MRHSDHGHKVYDWNEIVIFFYYFHDAGFQTSEVYDHIMKGHRMSAPPKCPKYIYDMMLSCWSEHPDDRPSFKDLKPELENLNRYELAWALHWHDIGLEMLCLQSTSRGRQRKTLEWGSSSNLWGGQSSSKAPALLAKMAILQYSMLLWLGHTEKCLFPGVPKRAQRWALVNVLREQHLTKVFHCHQQWNASKINLSKHTV